MKVLMIFSIFLGLTNITQAEEPILWEKIATEDNIDIFGPAAKNGVLPFKAEGIINSNINTVFAILKDMKHKNQWAPKLEKVKLHKQNGENKFWFSEYYQTPWPATDREFLLAGTIERPTYDRIILKAHSVDQNDNYKGYKSPDHIQADVKYLNVTLNQVSQNETRISFEFHGDMKGWMPVWLMNLIQKKWPLRFIQGLRKYSAEKDLVLSYNQVEARKN